MKGICPICEKETDSTFVERMEDILIRGERIGVHVEYLKCMECEGEFDDPNSTYDSLNAAYREYRERCGLLQPEVIKNFRVRLGLSQIELANLLGLGGATLSRYENGALQDEAHNTLIVLAMQPENLIEMIEEKPKALNELKREKTLKLLREMSMEHNRSFANIFETRFGDYAPNIMSGFQALNVIKLLSAMIYFCRGAEIPKTKLNKLLFYADFKHYKEYAVSITGVCYVHLPYGPVPDNFELYLAALIEDENAIAKTEIQFNESMVGEYLGAKREPDLNVFGDTELKILASVKEYFSDFNAKKISAFSHREKGYQATHEKELISFEYAKYLQI